MVSRLTVVFCLALTAVVLIGSLVSPGRANGTSTHYPVALTSASQHSPN